MEAVLDFLAGVGVKGPDATKVLKKFPEVIACSVEERLQENVRKLERDWKIKGPAATNVIKRQPQVRDTCCVCDVCACQHRVSDTKYSIADLWCAGAWLRDRLPGELRGPVQPVLGPLVNVTLFKV